MARTRPLALVAAAAILTGAAVAPFPASVPIPNDFAPEGVAVGTGSTFYVGSLRDGDVYRGDLRSGRGALLVDTAGRQAVGMKVEEEAHRLWTAGGVTGRVFAYDTRTGATVADVPVAPPGSALLNDVVVTGGAVYVTDSFNPVLYVVPLGPDGAIGSPAALPVTGPAGVRVGFPGLNGIDATASGDTLVVNHTLLGGLYTIDPRTGASREIALPGGAVTPGFSDGILLHGRTLWVVENLANRLVRLELTPDLSSGVVVEVIDNDDVGGLFRAPTTAARHGDHVVLVNGRFDLGLPPPFGPGAPAGTDYDVVLVPAR